LVKALPAAVLKYFSRFRASCILSNSSL